MRTAHFRTSSFCNSNKYNKCKQKTSIQITIAWYTNVSSIANTFAIFACSMSITIITTSLIWNCKVIWIHYLTFYAIKLYRNLGNFVLCILCYKYKDQTQFISFSKTVTTTKEMMLLSQGSSRKRGYFSSQLVTLRGCVSSHQAGH